MKKLDSYRIVVYVIAYLLLSNFLFAQGDLHYHYFKKKIPLNLSTDEILIQRTQGISKAALAVKLQNLEVTENDIQEHPIKNLLTVNVPPHQKSIDGIRSFIADLAIKDDIRFVSPSYVGDDRQS